MFGLPAGRDQKIGALDGLLGGAGQHHLDALAQRAHALDLDVAADRDALARQRVEHDGDAFRVFLGERLRRNLQHRHLGAEPAERLRELEPARARAEDDQVLGPLARVEDVLVGEIRALRRCRRSTAPTGCEPVAITKRRALISNLTSSSGPSTTVRASRKRASPSMTRTCMPVKRSLESFGAIASMTRCTWSLTWSNSTAGFASLTPNGPLVAERLRALARGDHRLRRHAAGVEALAAHPALLDQHHGHAERRRRGRDRQAGGACADDAKIGGQLLGHQNPRLAMS